ncbi:MAG TPA: permease-like cell division protein FtsX [Thermoanaerobaculia bacterium]|nr:permease-like cell division protein FtsX [Thermoanaerobaculia bacterium]
MRFLQALRYFVREAAVNLLRSWKVSLLAVLTIAVSLFIGGAFLVVSGNLAASVERWRSEMRLVIYLRPETTEADLRRLAAEAARGPGVVSVEPVTAAAARRRFQEIFPGLSELVAGWQDEPLPASLEIGLDSRQAASPPGRKAWLDGWRKRPEVTLVDDDREWLGQLETVVAVVRAVGLALVGGLLGAAIFTIASVIRLTAYLHHEEIEIMRLVGATEFFIRGPFYAEGLLQGLIGGLLASGALYGVYQGLHARGRGSFFSSVLALDFLSPPQVTFLVLLGGAAGLFGAVASLRREAL